MARHDGHHDYNTPLEFFSEFSSVRYNYGSHGIYMQKGNKILVQFYCSLYSQIVFSRSLLTFFLIWTPGFE